MEITCAVMGTVEVPHGRLMHLSTETTPLKVVYPFWVLRDGDSVSLIDTGFDREIAEAKGIKDYVDRLDLLARLGIAPEDVTLVHLTHLHWDHFASPEVFPNATMVVQRDDVDYFLGRALEQPLGSVSHPDTPAAIAALRDAGRLRILDGDATENGVTYIHVGGHTPGSQLIMVPRENGSVLFTGDAAHFYDNVRTNTPASIMHSYDAYLRGFRTIEAFGAWGSWMPGHDPEMLDLATDLGGGLYRLT